MKAHAIRIVAPGPPEAMGWCEVEVAPPRASEVRLRHTAIGVNYGETLRRGGRSPAHFPGGLGHEAVGVVEAVGRSVTGLKPGDRVGYTGRRMTEDAYSEMRVVPAARLIRIPNALGDAEAAAILVKGVCAQYLLKDTYRVRRGDTILVHAAAGGVGSLLCQWAAALGATVIGVVGRKSKIAAAQAAGCVHVVVPRGGKFAGQVRELTAGTGVDCVYDSVGLMTWNESLACVRRHGMAVSFGGASGDVRDMDLFATGPLGSPRIVRATMANYIVTDDELRARARDLFRAVARGMVTPRIGRTFALKEAAQAHRALEARRTTGSTVLIP